MPHISQMKDSKFLKKEDCDPPILVTITQCHEENVAKTGADPEMKWCLSFKEQAKPMVLNGTNAQIIAKITGSENTEDWTGKKIVLYHDPNVSFGNKLVGGIRVRAPKPRPATPGAPPPARRPAPPPPPVEQPSEDYGDAYEGDAYEDIPY